MFHSEYFGFRSLFFRRVLSALGKILIGEWRYGGMRTLDFRGKIGGKLMEKLVEFDWNFASRFDGFSRNLRCFVAASLNHRLTKLEASSTAELWADNRLTQEVCDCVSVLFVEN
jgi:hypothetical protein